MFLFGKFDKIDLFIVLMIHVPSHLYITSRYKLGYCISIFITCYFILNSIIVLILFEMFLLIFDRYPIAVYCLQITLNIDVHFFCINL